MACLVNPKRANGGIPPSLAKTGLVLNAKGGVLNMWVQTEQGSVNLDHVFNIVLSGKRVIFHIAVLVPKVPGMPGGRDHETEWWEFGSNEQALAGFNELMADLKMRPKPAGAVTH